MHIHIKHIHKILTGQNGQTALTIIFHLPHTWLSITSSSSELEASLQGADRAESLFDNTASDAGTCKFLKCGC